MKRIRQTIEVSEPLWRALELMSRDMGVDRDALVAQALFQLARQNGYVAPKVVPLSVEEDVAADAGKGPAAQGCEPMEQAVASVAVSVQVVPARPALPSVPEAVEEPVPPIELSAGEPRTPSAEAEAEAEAPFLGDAPATTEAFRQGAEPADTPVANAALDGAAIDEPATEPTGSDVAPSASAKTHSPELVLARMQEILAEVEASVQPSEGLATDSADDSDDDADADSEDGPDDADADSYEASNDSDVESGEGSEEGAGEPGEDSAESDAIDATQDVSGDDLAAELAALGVADDAPEVAQAAAPAPTPIRARPLSARPVPKVRPPDEAETISEDPSAEATNIVKAPASAPAPLEVFVRLAQGSPVAVSSGRFTIGRGPRCNLVVRSERVSREHAVVTRVGDEVFIEDLNSSNGTWFNDERITRQQVSDGDEFRLGTEAVFFTMRPAGG